MNPSTWGLTFYLEWRYSTSIPNRKVKPHGHYRMEENAGKGTFRLLPNTVIFEGSQAFMKLILGRLGKVSDLDCSGN